MCIYKNLVYLYVYVYIYIYIHTHTYIYIYIYISPPSLAPVSRPPPAKLSSPVSGWRMEGYIA